MKEKTKNKIINYFKEGFWNGLGWSFGVTVGFVLVSTILVVIVHFLGGLPLIGNIAASIVEATNKSLINRSVF